MPRSVSSPLSDDPGFSQLATLVEARAAGGQIDYFPSPGNWGDSLINAGAREFFVSNRLAVRSLARSEVAAVPPEQAALRLAVVGGGGGWNRNWRSSIEFTKDLSRLYRWVIVLPSSYDPELFQPEPGGNVELVARGRGASARVADLVCHDMAFLADFAVEEQQQIPYPLIALRRDKERSSAAVDPDRNWDLSLLGDAGTSHVGLLELIARFSTVYTDRLHIAIAGSVLGLQVKLLDGNYGKNAEVFETSLRGVFPDTELRAWDEVDWETVTGYGKIGAPGY